MDLKGLRALVEVVREGGFTRAAKTVFATQSTVSKAVKNLEDELGVPLLSRAGRRCSLTEAGEIVYRRAVGMLAERDDMLLELEDLQGLKRGVLRLGIPPIGSSPLFAPVYAAYRASYPGVVIRFVEHGSRRLEEMVLSGELELAASLLPVSGEFQWQDLSREPIDALVRADHPLADRESVTLQDLKQNNFILFGPEFVFTSIILDACRRAGFTPHVPVSSSQIAFVVELVAAGLGTSFLPRMIAMQRSLPEVRVIPVADEGMQWNMALIWRRDGYLSQAARAWLSLSARIWPVLPRS